MMKVNDKYGLYRLRFSDSVVVKVAPSGGQSLAANAAHAFAKRRGWKVMCRKEGEGVRITRLQ